MRVEPCILPRIILLTFVQAFAKRSIAFSQGKEVQAVILVHHSGKGLMQVRESGNFSSDPSHSEPRGSLDTSVVIFPVLAMCNWR